MVHEERNETIRLKLLDEIADIEAFIDDAALTNSWPTACVRRPS